MKTPFSKVRGLGLFKRDKRHRHAIKRSVAQLDELSQASQDMQDMRDCYDSLLSAAAGTTNTAYEFSESLQEMGDCLLEKTALSDDEDIGRVLLMLGKVQFDIQKMIDNYRSHIYQTITAPSQSLLNELGIVEDMKRQCDEKRATYEALKLQYDKGNLNKEENVSSHQLQSAQDEFDEDATLFIFRMKSLKRGQSHSLLTQAARHYAAQMCFFRKALESMEAIEPHVKSITEEQHIDYCFSGLEDDNDRDSIFLSDDDDDDEVSSLQNPTEARKNEAFLYSGSKSAPLYMEGSFDHYKKYQQMRQSSTRKLNTYVLPTPVEKSSVTSATESQHSQPINMWHSMPLEHKKYEKKPMLSVSGPIASDLSLPKIRELHELPRPPATKKPSKLGFSEPLVTFNRGPDFNDAKKMFVFDAAYRLPVPSTSQRDTVLASKQTDVKGMCSPPLSPISFKNILQGSTVT
ncbi:hypothetical protein L2E82_42212 [Cichorium intybus]|uniref:Uncharacterized protein n=1 Tax=Cichorium intybus TaxID=13427 RepID=A0ACB8ZL83_CICIN|nr:hypothetical protein L2E82_42212 [Cichorium intybus]